MRYLLLAVTASLALAGCGGEDSGGQAGPSPTTASASLEDAYIAELAETGPTYEVRRDPDRFVDLGWQVCEGIDAGRMDDYRAATTLVSVERLSLAHAEALVAAAREHLCPELD